MCLLAFSAKEEMTVNGGVFLAFAPSVFFVQDVLFVVLAIAGVALSIMGLSQMRQDTKSNIHIHVGRSMQHGLGRIVFSFSLVIASFYYMQIRTVSGEELLQKLAIDTTSHAVLTQVLGMVNPDFRKANQENVTVDEFLLAFQKNQSANEVAVPIPSDIELLQMEGMTPADPRATQTLIQIKKGLKDNAVAIDTRGLVLDQGRKQLSDIVGKPLSGEESIADVLAQVINQRIRTYFQPTVANSTSLLLPFVLAVILFVTLWSLGAILTVVWRIITGAAFSFCRRVGVLEIKKVMVEQEVIE